MAGNFVELDFVGIGVSRCGTTWLAKCLADHPEIFVPPEKELKYYNNPEVMRRRPVDSYFSKADGSQILGEYTPRYIIYRSAMERIRDDNPDARILVALRDPVERAFSQYKYFRYNLEKEDAADFEAALEGRHREDYVSKSRYAEHLGNAFEIFGRGSVHVVFYADIETDPETVIRDVYGFVGADETFRPLALDERLNPSGPKAGGVLRTDLSTDGDVMVRGSHIGILASVRAAGRNAVEALRIRRFVEPVAVPVLDRIQLRIERLAGRIAGEASYDATADDDTIDEETRRRVYRKYFAEQVECLEDMLGEDLARWKY